MHTFGTVRSGRTGPGWIARGMLAIVAAFLLALVPLTAAAQGSETTPTDIQVRIDGPINVPAGTSTQNVVVVSDNATVDGTVTDQLVVISGDAQINGEVQGSVVLINGHLTLGPGAKVGNDVMLYHATISQDPSASIAGSIHQQYDVSFDSGLYIWFWLSMTILLLVAGIVYALAAGRQLDDTARTIGRQPGMSIVGTVIYWVLIPILAILAFVTIVGIPLGLAILFFLIPVLAFFGYLVTGTAVGALLLRLIGRRRELPVHPILAVIVGVLVLQVIGLVPFLGGPVVFLASSLGAGALIYRTWRQMRGAAPAQPEAAPSEPMPTEPPPPAPAAPAA